MACIYIPLLNLPDDVVKNILQNWGSDSLIFFSTLSTRAKHLVKSLNRKAVFVEFNLRCTSEISIFTPSNHSFKVVNPEKYNRFEYLTPLKLEQTSLFGSSTGIFLSLPGYGIREWLRHFMYIFNQSMISLNFAHRAEWVYTLQSIQEALKGLKIMNLNVRDVNENVCEVLRLFPVMHVLNTNTDQRFSTEDSDFMKKLLLGYIPYVDLAQLMPVDLDTLLAMNCQEFRSSRVLLSDKELNTFLKLWLKGSNPNLQSLRLSYWDRTRRFDEGIILKGIKYEKKPVDEIRTMQPERLNPYGYIRLTGGYDIVRMSDGRMATVLFDPRSLSFSMFLWPS